MVHAGSMYVIQKAERTVVELMLEDGTAGLGDTWGTPDVFALLQRFGHHWLVHCGGDYATTAEGGELTAEQITKLAVFSLEHANTAPDVLVAVLKIGVEKMLAEAREEEDEDEDE